MVLADFSKAFDMLCFLTTIHKFSKLGFSKLFPRWLVSYLSGRSQFVQIDDKSSSYKFTQFGIPQSSILGPLVFNLYVADLRDTVPLSTTKCVQYADDTTLYQTCTAHDLASGEVEFNRSQGERSAWSQNSNLALNSTKTKSMLLSTYQMSSYNSLGSNPLQLSVKGKKSGACEIDQTTWGSFPRELTLEQSR